MNKTILFLDRNYIFNLIHTDKYNSIYVALTKKHKLELEAQGHKVVACFEDEYDHLTVAQYPNDYLIYSYCNDRFLNVYSFKKRQEILGKEISFWANILDTYKPCGIVNEVCTMEWMEVMYIEATKRNIPYHCFQYGMRKGYSYWLDTPFSSRIKQERWDNAKPSIKDKKDAEDYYNNVREKHSKPFYVQNLKDNKFKRVLLMTRYYLKCWWEFHTNKKFIYENYKEISKVFLKCSVARLFAKYDDFESLKNIDCSYVYYPIHFEPEATLYYYGDPYIDQANNILEIALSLGANQRLIVKEHPQQAGMLGTERFQQIKRRCSNIVYLKASVSNYDVLKITDLMVTLNGTAGLEAMILDKPTIVLGSVFYDNCRSVTRVNDFRELRTVIRNNLYNIPQKDDIVEMLSKFFSMQTKGYPAANFTGDIDDNIDDVTNIVATYANGE